MGLKQALARSASIVAAAAFVSACAHGRPAAAPEPPRAQAPHPAENPIAERIAEADAELATGIAEIKDGHLDRAREAFDRAVDAYLSAPGGAYGDPRLAEAYRRTLDAIHVRELEALAAGDGFTESSPDPASIDEVAELAVTEAPASEEARSKAEGVVQGEGNDLPVELNDKVLSCIDLYQGRLRDWFAGAISRGQRYLPRIRAAFASEGVPQDLAYVALVESAFHPTAFSRARARGVWQFVAATGRRYGLQQDWWVDERSDPEKATRAAARYLKELYTMFGDWNLALAGYNAGEAVVQRGIDRYKTTDFWKLSRTRAFRRETRNYVPLIHAAIVVAKAPEQYGFEVPQTPPLAYEAVPVRGAVDLRTIAECTDTAVDEIRLLNPELRRLATPANRTFDLKVPVGKGPALGSCLEALPPDKRVRFRTHVVARGQSLASIAKANGISTRDLAEANALSTGRRLAVGTELIIPIDPRARALPARHDVGPARTAPELGGDAARITYRIKPGDTLTGIASLYGTTVRELQSWNKLRGTRIAAGDTLTIYTSRKF